MRFRIRLRIMPRPGILDPQGQAVAHALEALGFAGIADARIGRSVEYALEAADPAGARDAARRMCERLLANPVTEDFTIDAVEPAG